METTEILVSFLCLPATVFIIIPLVMLCCWSLYRLGTLLIAKLTFRKPSGQSDRIKIQPERSF